MTKWRRRRKRYPARCAYDSHRNRAIQSNIGWEFTFDEWVLWWKVALGRSWLIKRGSASHRYVMARFGDTGPYHPMNVKCITSAQNKSEACRPKGSRQWRAVLTEEVVRVARSLYVPHSREFGTRALARRFGVQQNGMARCLRGETWKHVRD